ncbi:Charged multivesicular body protein 1a [Coelomomyces lativittatus]|nr:Charged multivesicular body protein 1a [Coelomomyces lativittatus]KAJ1499277.1 Charged multivesicular body protein 1a [Coelomomyces lativittatus]KAJ1501779.1 Charged multivesicular body protein 1a [Coelomomyces lativittatus]
MRQVTRNMSGVVGQMDKAMQSMNLEQISMVMDKFEQQFEDLDVQTQYMDGAMQTSTSMSTPQHEVDLLMQQVAEEHGLELNMELLGVPSTQLVGGPVGEKVQEASDLDARLTKLRNP